MSAVIPLEKYSIRTFNEGDLDQVLAIENNIYGFPWTRKIFRDCVQIGYSCYLVEYENQILAYGVMSMGAGEAHLLNLSVSKLNQGKGIGGYLLDAFIAHAIVNTINTIFLEVRPSNSAAINLYENKGFNQVGQRRDYYPTKNGREDAFIYALDISGL